MDPFEIWGNGQQDRNFTYVGDIVEGSIRACEHITDGSAINVGTAEHVKIIELAKMIFDQIGWEPRNFNFDMSKPVGVFSRAADVSCSRELLGWEPSVSVEEGLRRTIDWYYKEKNAGAVAESLGLLLTER